MMCGQGAMKWQAKTETTKWKQFGFNLCHFQLYILHKAAKSMGNLTRPLYGNIQQAVCLCKEDGAI